MDQSVQSSHHEPALRAASARHACGVNGWLEPASYHALGVGGLTMPAMCPPLERMKRTSPPSSWTDFYELVHGTMWSLMAPTTYVGFLIVAQVQPAPVFPARPGPTGSRVEGAQVGRVESGGDPGGVGVPPRMSNAGGVSPSSQFETT